MKRIILLACTVSLIFLLSSCAFLSEQLTSPVERSFQDRMVETKEMLRRSNVGVEVTLVDDDALTNDHVKRGSGVIFASLAGYHYILTSFHVVDAEDYDTAIYKVVPSVLKESYEAELVAQSFPRDLALLRFRAEEAEDELAIIDIENRKGDTLRRREFVFAVGNPHTLEGIVTFGEYLGMIDVDEVDFRVIKHDAAIFTGSSGGALADIDGNLVGINTWGTEEDDVNLAVPLSEILEWLEALDYFTTELLATDKNAIQWEVVR